MASGSVSELASRSASRRAPRGHGQIDRRQERAVARSAQRSGELEVGAGRGIDFGTRPPRAPRWSGERRPGLELGTLDVGEGQGRGGDLGAGERAEAIEGFDAIELAEPPFGRRDIAAVAREQRGRNAHRADDLGKQRFVVHGLRSDDLAWLQARNLRGKARFVRLAERNRARRQIEGRETVGLPSLAGTHLLDGRQKTRAARLQQPLLGDRAGRDQPNDVAPDDRLRSRFFAAAGSSSCSQTATRWPSAISRLR